MKREEFIKVAEESLDSLPEEFSNRIRNVAILVEDLPPSQPAFEPGQPKRLLLGISTACRRHRKVSLIFPPGLRTSCFTRRILKQFAAMSLKSDIKFARR